MSGVEKFMFEKSGAAFVVFQDVDSWLSLYFSRNWEFEISDFKNFKKSYKLKNVAFNAPEFFFVSITKMFLQNWDIDGLSPSQVILGSKITGFWSTHEKKTSVPDGSATPDLEIKGPDSSATMY